MAFKIWANNLNEDNYLNQANYQPFKGGENASPSLKWSGLPQGTKSLVLTILDVDAREGAGFTHWIAVDIDPNINNLPEGASNNTDGYSGVLFKDLENQKGTTGYLGAGTPEGKIHCYEVELTAINKENLNVSVSTSINELKETMEQFKIESTRCLLYGKG